MRNEEIEVFLKNRRLRTRQIDKEKIKSLVNSSRTNAEVVLSMVLTEKSATVIFREIYESIRQLGDVQWWLLGYEPLDHDVSLIIFKDIRIITLKYYLLDRFKKIRHDINYRGFTASILQAKEIIAFWNETSEEIIKFILERCNY